MTEKKDLAKGMLALTYAQLRIKKSLDALRKEAKGCMTPTERVPLVIDGDLVGAITKEKKEKHAYVSDELAYREWMQANYRENVVSFSFIEDVPKAIEVLEKYAPNLVHTRLQVAESVTADILRASEKAGAPVGPGKEADIPGIRVESPEGTVKALITRDSEVALAHLEHIVSSGAVSLDGTVRKELEAR